MGKYLNHSGGHIHDSKLGRHPVTYITSDIGYNLVSKKKNVTFPPMLPAWAPVYLVFMPRVPRWIYMEI